MIMNEDKNKKEGINLSKFRKKELDVKSQGRQWSSGVYVSPFAPKIIQWVVRYSGGLIRNEKQAYYVVFGLIVFVVIISLFLIFSRGLGPKTLEPTGPAIEEAGSPRDITPY